MKKFVSYLALCFAGVCCVVAAYFCHYYYTLYRASSTALEARIHDFDMRLAHLEAHKARELTPEHFRGIISTTDMKPLDSMSLGQPLRGEGVLYEVTGAKGGPVIHPELRIPYGSTNILEYDIHVDSRFGVVAGAWISHFEPSADLTALLNFHVYCPKGTNIVRLIARVKPDASIRMRFNMVVLCQH